MKFRLPFFRNRPNLPEKARLTVSAFLDRCLFLDIEARGERIYHRGAVAGEKTFELQGRFNVQAALEELDAFGKDAEAVLGHNILEHDLPLPDGRKRD